MTEQALRKAANFGDLALNLEQNHEIDLKVEEIGPILHNQKGNRYQECSLSDGQEQQKVKIWEGRNGTALAEINLKKCLTFNLSARRGSGKWANNVYYGGFWEMEAPVIAQAPQRTAQTPVNPVARSIVPDGRNGMRYPDVYAFPVTPETQERMSRSVAVEAASRVVAAMLMAKWQIPDESGIDSKLLQLSDMLSMWIKSGNAQVEEPQAYDVCTSCQQLRVDCTCPTEQFIR
ncbi:MAG: hypothetical protein MUO31_13215 [Thermodesulfovibrionales bacterium]|nr:hypothetical protein [Thermodesulfovibrionales bacterium]